MSKDVKDDAAPVVELEEKKTTEAPVAAKGDVDPLATPTTGVVLDLFWARSVHCISCPSRSVDRMFRSKRHGQQSG